MENTGKKIIFILVLVLIFRICFVFINSNFMHTDEAIHGLMAKHIITRGTLPVFSYEEEITGVLYLYPAALSFMIFGVSNMAFKIIPVMISVIFVYLIYILGSITVNRKTGIIAMLFAGFCPPFLNMWSVNACSEYITIITMGTLILILGIDIICDRHLKPNTAYLLLGLISGIGFWINPLIISYILTVFLLVFITDKKIFFKPVFALFITGFLIGNAPMIIFNASSAVRAAGGLDDSQNWLSYITIFGETNVSILSKIATLPSKLREIAAVSIPIMIGGFVWELESSIIRKIIAVILMAVFWISVIYTLYKRIIDTVLNRKEIKKIDFLIIQFILTIMIFSVSKFGFLTKEPRYLLPIFTAIPIFQAIFLCEIKFKTKKFFVASVSGILLLNIYGNISFSRTVDPDHSMCPYDKKLIKYLVENNIKTPASDYWVAYQITFATNEKVIGIPFGLQKFAMYKNHIKRFNNIHYLIFPKVTLHDRIFKYFSYGLDRPLRNDEEFTEYLKSHGVSNFKTYKFDYYTLFYTTDTSISEKLINSE
ncbi:MAG: glycosyltransferase family 39 protein [Elusimicrobia bacterium]|nr:glycosyltransferase family 39 protein [Elusimicrobiota bacterium]